MTRWPWIISSCSGQIPFELLELHRRYGPVVRIAPNELSYNNEEAWRSIYGHRAMEMNKDKSGGGYLPDTNGHESIVTAFNKEDHQRMRKAVTHAFSDKALREQAPLLQVYFDLFITKLGEQCDAGNVVDLNAFFNWTTFDLMGDLTYAEPFDCLKNGSYHSWVALVFQSVKFFPFGQAALWMGLWGFKDYLTPGKLAQAKLDADHLAFSKADRRMEKRDLDRKDFFHYIINTNGDKSMSLGEIHANSVIFIIAGSETTATFLCGCLFYLLSNPRSYHRLVAEVREHFATYESINMTTVNQLKYLSAVVDESFRIYPPAPFTSPRVVPGKGENLMGSWVPGGTVVGVNQWACNQDEANFYQPGSFLPERWLEAKDHHEGDVPAERFANDKPAVVKPFSYGPRNCIGLK